MMNVMNLLSENEMLNTFIEYMLQNNKKFSMLNISTKKKC